MRADYLDHRALDDDLVVVYLMVRVPDGRVLLQKNERKRLVPRLSGDWQCTLSKKLTRGSTNLSALKTLVFTTFSWHEKTAEDAKFLMKFGLNRRTVFVYLLTMNKTVYIQPGAGAEIRALPWNELVQQVYSKNMQFSDETYSVVDVIHSHNGGDFSKW